MERLGIASMSTATSTKKLKRERSYAADDHRCAQHELNELQVSPELFFSEQGRSHGEDCELDQDWWNARGKNETESPKPATICQPQGRKAREAPYLSDCFDSPWSSRSRQRQYLRDRETVPEVQRHRDEQGSHSKWLTLKHGEHA